MDNENKSTDEIILVPITRFIAFPDHPFKVRMDESMNELAESIKLHGVLSPVIARPQEDDILEMIAGHRRLKACELADVPELPTIIKNLDDDEAIILLVDSNLHREDILPSEKAYAYQMKLEAMKRKAGRHLKENFVQIGQNFSPTNSRKELAAQTGESSVQIQRYIRLTNLIDPLLQMVDDKKIALNAAVELSYLGSKAQSDVVKAIESEEIAPSIAQSKKIRQLAQNGKLNLDAISSVMIESKPEKVKVIFGEDKLLKYFPKNYTPKQMEEIIEKLLKGWARRRSEPER